MADRQEPAGYWFPADEPKVTQSLAVCYHFRWERGWAIYTVNDLTGELSIQSDWGAWAYRWDARGFGGGQTLTQFLCTTGPDYVLNKLGYNNRELRDEVLDEAGTRKLMKQRIIEARREGRVSRTDARWAWDHIDDFVNGVEHPSRVYDQIRYIEEEVSELYDICFKDVDHEYLPIAYEEPVVATILREKLLPVFFDHLRSISGRSK